MKPIARILLSALLLAPLVACQDDRNANKTIFQPEGPGQGTGYIGPNSKPQNQERRNVTTNPTIDPVNDPIGDPPVENPDAVVGGPAVEMGPELGPATDPGAGGGAVPPVGSPPFAKPVPGMSGYVFSPFSPGKKIEVIGYPPGTVVKCPYTQKEFKVP
jgi:hypothetical protein